MFMMLYKFSIVSILLSSFTLAEVLVSYCGWQITQCNLKANVECFSSLSSFNYTRVSREVKVTDIATVLGASLPSAFVAIIAIVACIVLYLKYIAEKKNTAGEYRSL